MKNFEDDLKRLEELTAAIKRNDITLEDALADFEEGIKLAKGMEKELDAIESKIQILTGVKQAEQDSSAEEEADGEEAKTSRSKKSNKAKDNTEPVLDLFTPSTEVNGTRNA